MELEWDEAKRRENQRKHGIDFAEGEPVFFDPMALRIEDPDAEGEQRHVLVGLGFHGNVLPVTYTWRGDRARIVSARKATRRERRQYEEG